MARYSVNNYTVDVLLADIKSGNVAIPEMQRPFVWDATQVRDLMLSLIHISEPTRRTPISYAVFCLKKKKKKQTKTKNKKKKKTNNIEKYDNKTEIHNE